MIYTVGHSTHSADVFAAILHAHRVAQLADVRTVPASRRHPHFGREALERFLAGEGIVYRHMPALGGFRKPRADSINTAWRHPGFRGYADYMQTDAFARAVDELLTFAHGGRTVVMCSESVWWRCHRRLLSDALLVRDVPVRHILSTADPKPHHLSEFARLEPGNLTYPGLL